MLALGFSPRFVNLIFHCISSPQFPSHFYLMVINLAIYDLNMASGREIRFPYTLICLEAFSCLLQEVVLCSNISGVQLGHNGPIISHLLFADDMLLFGKATLQEAQHISFILQRYKVAMG